MSTRRTALLLATAALCLGSLAAHSSDGKFEVDLLAGAAFPSQDAGLSTTSVDEYGTKTSNAFHNEGKSGLSYGARARYVSSCGLGIEVSYERARLDLDSITRYDLSFQSVTGANAEVFQLTGSGKIEIDPLSVNLLYRARVLPFLALTASGGVSLERIEFDDRSKVGLVTYLGDSIETFAAETQATESEWRTTWNAGLDLDFRVAPWASLFVDGRYYGNARGNSGTRHVLPGSYAGLHLGGTVAVSAQAAALYDEQLRSASSPVDIDTKMVRAALGIRFRF
jgi:hypothetical protein